MKRIFAIAFGIMLALILLSPTMGYSFQIGNHSYTLKSARINYSTGIEAPSHEPVVSVSREPYSLKYDSLFQPAAKQLGETAKSIVIGKSTSAHLSAPVQSKNSVASTAQGKFFINGTVFNDKNGNGKMDNNETGLAGWTVNLQQPSGNGISKSITDDIGEYGFSDLAAGKYILAVIQNMGWPMTTPPDGKYGINLTDNVTGLNFGSEIIY